MICSVGLGPWLSPGSVSMSMMVFVLVSVSVPTFQMSSLSVDFWGWLCCFVGAGFRLGVCAGNWLIRFLHPAVGFTFLDAGEAVQCPDLLARLVHDQPSLVALLDGQPGLR